MRLSGLLEPCRTALARASSGVRDLKQNASAVLERVKRGEAVEVTELQQAAVRSRLLDPPELRTVDAVHLASARELGTDLKVIITYDERMANAALDLGLPLQVPC